ncbi:MAG: hypothetical protein ACRECT_03205 [Thermoplasmata archaeon]
MTRNAVAPRPERTEENESALEATLPLIVVAGGFFVISLWIRASDPRYGPAHFPIWSLLFLLGFIAALGAIVSLFFAAGDKAETEDQPAARPGARREFGRPMPDAVTERSVSESATPSAGFAVATSVTPEPWSEDALPPVSARGPRPILTTPDDPGDIGRRLEEIAEIQRDLMNRRATRPSASESPARA